MKAVLVCNIMHALWCWTDYWSCLLLQETWWEHRDSSKTRAADLKEKKKKSMSLRSKNAPSGWEVLQTCVINLWILFYGWPCLNDSVWSSKCYHAHGDSVILHDTGVVVTPEVMNHIEIANLWEKPSYSFSVVLAVSNRSGPAHKNNFSHNTGQKNTKAFIWRNNGKNMRRVFKQRLGHNLWS